MKLAFLYAGQGTQHVGMGADFYQHSPTFRTPFDSAHLPFDLKSLCFSDPEGQLNATQYTQPAMVAFAAGVTAMLYEAGIRPEVVAGLSLGEYSALHAAGVLTARDAIELVAFRGQVMATAVENRPCGMAAVLKLDRVTLQACCDKASHLGVAEIANYNCPGQIVIGGDGLAVEKACELAKESGAGRCVPLKVSGPFHTSLMSPAGDALRERFATVDFSPMDIPVVFNATGDTLQPSQTIPELLEKQVQSAVHLEDSICRMAEMGVDTIIEIGPGKALSSFVKKTAKGIQTHSIETLDDLTAVIAALRGDSP